MTIRVTYHGPARDWAGADDEAIDLEPGATLAELSERLFRIHPALRRRASSLRFAVNLEFTGADAVLYDGDEVAAIPPVSGGSGDDRIEVSAVPIDVGAIRRLMGNGPESGGCVTFEGIARADDHPEYGPLRRLEYDAHAEMAIRNMGRLVAEARKRWPLHRLAIVHRTGRVEIGEPAVVVAVAAAHRAEAFEACRWLIDTLKQDVPIWKQEVWHDGTRTWAQA